MVLVIFGVFLNWVVDVIDAPTTAGDIARAFLVIYLVIQVVLIIGVCFWCCCRKRRRKGLRVHNQVTPTTPQVPAAPAPTPTTTQVLPNQSTTDHIYYTIDGDEVYDYSYASVGERRLLPQSHFNNLY